MPNPQAMNKPRRPVGTRSRATISRRVVTGLASDQRAQLRYRVVRLAQESGGSLSDQLQAVRAAFDAGLIEGAPPSRTTLYEWLKRAEDLSDLEQQPSINDFRDRPRSGRPSEPLDPEVAERLMELAKADLHPSISGLHRSLVGWAKSQGKAPPKYAQVYRTIEAIGSERLSAWRHGSRAAIADAMLHPTVPASYTHEVWTLDEMEMPVWMRAFDREKAAWIAVVPSLVFVICNRSRAIVSYHLADPARRGKTSGFDSDDALATLLSASLPELAPSACLPFSGFLPKILRWDKAQQHVALLSTVAGIDVEVPDLPGRTPYSRGKVERPVSTLKDLCAEILGFKAKWDPITPKRPKDPRAKRSEAVATSFRETTKLSVSVGQLLTYGELCLEIDAVIRTYNEEMVHSKLGTTPSVAYFENLDRRLARPGRDALLLMKRSAHVVRKGTLPHRGVEFVAESQGRKVSHGTVLEFRGDPLLRGIFIEAHGEDDIFCLPIEEWSRRQDPTEFARERYATARAYSMEGEAARERHRIKVVGIGSPSMEESVPSPSDTQVTKQRRSQKRPDPDQIALSVEGSGAPRIPSNPDAAATPKSEPKAAGRKPPKRREKVLKPQLRPAPRVPERSPEPQADIPAIPFVGGLPPWLAHDPRLLVATIN